MPDSDPPADKPRTDDEGSLKSARHVIASVYDGPTPKPVELWPGAHPVPPLWSDRIWPVSTAPAPRAALIAAAGSGVLGALVLSADEIGVGLVLLASAALLTALATAPRTVTLRQGAFAALATALFGVATFRAAPWLIGLCLLAGLLTALLAITGGRSWTGLLLGTFAPLGAFSRAARWTSRGVTPHTKGATIGRGVVIGTVSLVLLVVFGALFAGADPVFADLLGGLVPEVPPALAIVRTILFVLVAAGALIAACLAHQKPDFDAITPGRGAGRPRPEWAVPLGALNALFACFVGVQLVVLADGNQHVLRTAGLTYAEYARQGFWQLLAVTALTLLVVAVVVRVARRETAADRTTLRVLLGALCLLAVLVVASALRRMWLYEDAYGFTRLRVLVQAVEFWLGGVFVLIAVAGIRLRGRWLPRAVIATGALTLLALAAVNPDAFIAERNVVRYAETGRIDVASLSDLSPDAVPALDRLPAPQRACALQLVQYQLTDDEAWYTANTSRARAREILRARPATNC
ncbi:DUF4153 domain-containing protein [Cryptosporangium arvum]|uniref:DUF4153 domain-containing protein n=1 Tax=Cryptosporangium arvum TaxID=80871 RepID=UPI0004B618AE|nr:DUF4173 domain-containing protein [Cryptosporangium arvum]